MSDIVQLQEVLYVIMMLIGISGILIIHIRQILIRKSVVVLAIHLVILADITLGQHNMMIVLHAKKVTIPKLKFIVMALEPVQ